jgi:hypothetical protein
MKDSHTGRTFYSCCGWNGDARDRTQSKRLATGCLRADHFNEPLNYDNQALRLQQLLYGATVTVPRPLLRYMRYDPASLLYDSQQNPVRGVTRLLLQPLSQTRQNYERLRTEGAVPANGYSNLRSARCEKQQHQDSIVVDPYLTSQKLLEDCLDSPLLVKSLQLEEQRQGCSGSSAVAKRCEGIWRIPSGNNNTRNTVEQQRTMPFVILGRFAPQMRVFQETATPL